MKNWQKLSFAMVLVLMLGTMSFADNVIFDSGAWNGNTAYTINNGFRVADDFVLTGAHNVSGFNVSLWTDGGAMPTSFDWAVYSDASGAPGSVLASGNANSLNSTFQGLGFGVYNVTMNNFPTAISLASGTFWLSLSNATSTDGYGVYWSTTNANGTNLADQYLNGNFYQNINPQYGGNVSFQVLESDTPEPGSLMLLGSGLLGVGSFVRRKLS